MLNNGGMEIISKSIEQIQKGDSGSFTKTVTESDIVLFGGISGDLNPAHFNEEYAKNSMFKARIAHGMLSATFISTVLGMNLPGPGTIYLSQEMKFLKPVYIGDTVTAIVKALDIIPEKNRVVFETKVENQRKELVIAGTAVVMPPKEKKEEEDEF